MKEIQLTQGQVSFVDDEDYEYLSQWKWYARYDHHTKGFYAVRNEGSSPHQKQISIHRALLGNPSGLYIDHVDGNSLNNTRGNLRVCTNGENTRNSGKRRNNKSGYKGVSWHTAAKKWRAKVVLNGKTVYCENFLNKEDAARAYDEAAKKYHGKFAKINLVP